MFQRMRINDVDSGEFPRRAKQFPHKLRTDVMRVPQKISPFNSAANCVCYVLSRETSA
jgi:hypothetical protein